MSLLPLGGSGVLHGDTCEVRLLRASTMTFASDVPTARLPVAMAVKWRGQVETRVRTFSSWQ